MAARGAGDVCSRNDTHWSDLGGLVAYIRLAKTLEQRVPMRRIRAEDVVFVGRQSTAGDLGYKVDVTRKEWAFDAALPARSARLIRDNRAHNTGSVVSTECPAAQGSCVLMGDSYGWALCKYLAESFERFTYVCTSTLDLDFIEREQPDVVVTHMAERFLVTVPDDEAGLSVAIQAARKLESGETRARVPFWDSVPVISPPVVDRMRANLLAAGGARDATILSLLAYAGLRPAELGWLRWGDIGRDRLRVRWLPSMGDPAEGMTLQRDLVGSLDRPAQEDRNVPLARELAADLERWRQSLDEPPRPNASVVRGSRGGGWQPGEWGEWVAGVYVPLATRNGLDEPRPHVLRDFFASRLIERGADAREVATQLGLGLVTVSARYGPWLQASKPGSAPASA